MVYSTRRFVLRLTLCYFFLVFFSHFSIAITSLGEERADLSAFRTFVRFALVWFCLFPHPLAVWEGLQFVIMASSWTFLLPLSSLSICETCTLSTRLRNSNRKKDAYVTFSST